jgi:hypothetical protein
VFLPLLPQSLYREKRKVICSVAEAQPTGLRVQLFSSRAKPGNYEITLDTSRQVLRLDIPEDYKLDFRSKEKSDQPRLYPSFAEAGLDASKFAPAAVLALKAKQFDDGFYACVEMAADAGLGPLAARKDLLFRLLQAVAHVPAGGEFSKTHGTTIVPSSSWRIFRGGRFS